MRMETWLAVLKDKGDCREIFCNSCVLNKPLPEEHGGNTICMTLVAIRGILKENESK